MQIQRMGQDVHQVEIQNKDMKIASANQKVLLSHIEQLMVCYAL